MSQPAPHYAPLNPSAPPAPVAPTAPFSVLAIVGLVLAFVAPLIGVVLSHVALAQTRRRHLRGRGLAIAGIVVNWALIVITPLFFWFAWIVFITMFGAQPDDYVDPFTFYWQIISTIVRDTVSP